MPEWRAAGFAFLTKYSVEQIKEDGMGGACGTDGEEEKYIQGFCNGCVKERCYLEELV
jgi:hypothetical protein